MKGKRFSVVSLAAAAIAPAASAGARTPPPSDPTPVARVCQAAPRAGHARGGSGIERPAILADQVLPQ